MGTYVCSGETATEYAGVDGAAQASRGALRLAEARRDLAWCSYSLQQTNQPKKKKILLTRALGLDTRMALQQLRCGDVRGGAGV